MPPHGPGLRGPLKPTWPNRRGLRQSPGTEKSLPLARDFLDKILLDARRPDCAFRNSPDGAPPRDPRNWDNTKVLQRCAARNRAISNARPRRRILFSSKRQTRSPFPFLWSRLDHSWGTVRFRPNGIRYPRSIRPDFPTRPRAARPCLWRTSSGRSFAQNLERPGTPRSASTPRTAAECASKPTRRKRNIPIPTYPNGRDSLASLGPGALGVLYLDSTVFAPRGPFPGWG